MERQSCAKKYNERHVCYFKCSSSLVFEKVKWESKINFNLFDLTKIETLQKIILIKMYQIVDSLSLPHFFLLYQGFKTHCVFYSYRTSSFGPGSVLMLSSHMRPETLSWAVRGWERKLFHCCREICFPPHISKQKQTKCDRVIASASILPSKLLLCRWLADLICLQSPLFKGIWKMCFLLFVLFLKSSERRIAKCRWNKPVSNLQESFANRGRTILWESIHLISVILQIL